MNVSRKNIRVLLSKPLKWFCVLPILLVSVVLFARNDRPFIPHKIKPQPLIKPLPLIKPMPVDRLSKIGSGFLFNPANIVINQCGSAPITLPTAADANFNDPTIIANYPNGPTWSDGSTGNSLTVAAAGTYYWQRTAANSVVNGNFELGDTGFQHAGYTDVTTTNPSAGLLNPAGTYAVGKNPTLYHNNFFTPNGDHTSGNGNMLIVNGSDTPNKIVWQETITVKPSTDYVFSFWAANISQADITNNNTSILQFSLTNGATTTPLGTITLSTANGLGAWQYFNTIWNSGSINGTVTIALINNNTNSLGGNDFAVDDILFAEIYRQQYNITMNPIPVLSVIGEICGVPSYDLTQTIIGYDLSTYTYTFKNGSGNILSGTQITSAPVGTYTITETDNVTHCTSNPANTTVSINPVPPLSVTSPPAQCAPYDLKNAINGRDDNTYTYTYQNGATTLGSSVVSASGTYTITATNKVTGCVSNPQNVTVTINLLANLTVADPNLACGITTYDLYNAITSTKTGYTYIYEDMAGTVLGTGTSFIVTGNATNTYQIIEQNASGCQSAPKTVTVTFKPTPVLLVNSQICTTASTYDLTTAIVGANTNYTYTYYRNGNSTPRTGSQITAASTSNSYTITATDNTTGCVSAAKPVTFNSGTPPTFTVTSPTLACGVTSHDLSTDKSGAGGTYTYTYMDSGGNILGSTVTTSGTYYIIATAGSCQSISQSINVTFKPAPTFTATSPTLACGVTSYDLSQAISGAGGAYTYVYKDSGGNTLASSTVSASGTYTITATNSTTGCVSTPQTVTVTLKPIPVLTVTSPPAQCGGTFNLSSAINSPDATVTYSYSSGASSVVSTSGAYIITATKNGCSTTATVNVTINPIPVLTVTSPAPQCGGTFDLHSAINSPDPTVTYTYSSGASPVVATSGTYTITATKNGCSTTATVNVTINPIPVLTVTSPSPQCVTYDLTQVIVGGYDPTTYTYVFKDPSGNVITLANAQAITQSGTYTITEQNKSTGCTSLPQQTTVTINPNPPKPGIIISTPY
jgi:hypothetical protein